MTDAAYTAETGTATAAEAARMRKAADTMDGTGGTHLGILPVAVVIVAVLALLDLVFGIIDTASWIVLIVGAAIILVPTAIIHRRGAAYSNEIRRTAAMVRQQAEAGEVQRHVLHRTAQHWFIEHEHGVMHLCPAGPGRTLFLDLSSVGGDRRYGAWFAKGRIHRATWRWTTAGDGAVLLGFTAAGEEVPPNSFAAALGCEDAALAADIFEALGSPADGEVIPRDFAAVDADLRARISAAKGG